jgi:parvulin-like peptidyl-prolyl isomerase
MKLATDWCSELKNSDLARWGLLDQVARERCIDRLLSNRPLPEPELLRQMRQELEQKLGLLDPEQRSQWLQQHGLSEEELDRMAARTWQWLMWCRERWGSGLETIFLRRKAEFDRVSYSMLRLRDAELAAELYQQIKEGESLFSDLASTFSEGPEKHSGGLLGPVPLSQPHPALAKLLQVSKPGQLWPPKRHEGWWLIVRLEKLLPASLDTNLQKTLLLEEGERALQRQLQQLPVQQR